MTLDCQVSSNPAANITWYRRRINRNHYVQNSINNGNNNNNMNNPTIGNLNANNNINMHSGSNLNINSNNNNNLNAINRHYSLFASIEDIKLNKFDTNELYYDELIGSGPTYTIASFNCANLMSNLKNRTGKWKNAKPIKQRTTQSSSTTSTNVLPAITASLRSNQKHQQQNHQQSVKNNRNQRDKFNEILLNSNEDEYYDYGKTATTTVEDYDEDENVKNEASTKAKDYYDATEYDYENIQFENEKQMNENDNDDFGIYICEASNKLANSHYKADSPYYYYNTQNHLAYRYIKINPTGPPIVRAVSAPSSTYEAKSKNEFFSSMVSMLMKSASLSSSPNPASSQSESVSDIASLASSSSPSSSSSLSSSSSSSSGAAVASALSKDIILNQAPLIEIATSIGSSVSLICLIEPVPQFDAIYWLKDTGRIIPNSKYTLFETEKTAKHSLARNYEHQSNNKNNQHEAAGYSIKLTTISSVKLTRNFKIKYENLTHSNLNARVVPNEQSSGLIYASLLATSTKPLQVSNSDYAIGSSNDENPSNVAVGLMRSVLYIRNVRKQDLGIYKCKAINQYGTRTALILLRERTLMGECQYFSLKIIIIFILFFFFFNFVIFLYLLFYFN
jgi:hypothetical protein